MSKSINGRNHIDVPRWFALEAELVNPIVWRVRCNFIADDVGALVADCLLVAFKACWSIIRYHAIIDSVICEEVWVHVVDHVLRAQCKDQSQSE